MEEKGMIGTIFDFSFDRFVTTKVIKILLGLAMIGNAVITIAVIVGGFNSSVFAGILAIILSPVIYVIMMLVSRIYLELIIVAFRIVEHLSGIEELLKKKEAAPAGK
ncbi:MAG: DUF4282 domain-containing protein [Candidatus Aureabacteria bacterium]|nr:DUF4282 domain-containing protein [Candidatus Auribacterota bacterium]